MSVRFILYSLVVLCSVLPLYSAAKTRTPLLSTTLSGFVLDSATKEPLINATVILKGTKKGAKTNKSGYFIVNDIPAGSYTVAVRFIGYEKFERPLSFRDGEQKKVTFELIPQSVKSGEVVVTADREIEKREISVSSVNIPVEQIKNIRIGGEADVFRALQFLPGVLSSSQVSSGLFIRGGSPDQNLVLIDGSNVYNPSHLFGFISTFNPEAIKDVELIKGGFPAQYGGRMSAVIDLTQKEGNKEHFEGLASLGLISSRASLQGPLGNGSWFIGGRRTYLDLLIAALPEDPANPLPKLGFYDVNAKVTQVLGPNDRIYASGFLSSDYLTIDQTGLNAEIGIGNRVGSLRWTHVFGDNLFSTVNVSGSNYRNNFTIKQSDFTSFVTNGITDYTLKADLEWFASNELTVKTGYEGNYYRFSYVQSFDGTGDIPAESDSVRPGNSNFRPTDWVHAAYAQLNAQITEEFSLQGGLRTNYWELSNVFRVDPRVAVRYQISDEWALKGAWGMYSQYFRLATLQDFSFFDTWLPTDKTVNPSYALHYIASIEAKPAADMEFNFDVYYKKLYNISEIRPFQTASVTVNDVFFSGNGEAYGGELFFQKKSGKLTGWIGYALGWVWATFPDINNGKQFNPRYDRRHDFKVVANYELTDTWDVGATFLFQSGQPFTGVTSRFRVGLPGESNPGSFAIQGDRYNFRLPPSHQLNLSASYRTSIFGLPAKLIIDIFNVYSRRDIFVRVFDTSKGVTEVRDVRLLPIIPSLSLEVKF